MTKSFKTLGMTVYAAMAVSATIDYRSTNNRSAGYFEFNEYRDSDKQVRETFTDCFKSGIELNKAIQSSFSEIQGTLSSRQEDPLGTGNNCYVGGNDTTSLIRREPNEKLTVQHPITHRVSWEVPMDSSTPTNSFYEQSHLKDCLA